MRWFWHSFIVHLLEALRPRVVIEIGAERGDVTRPLLTWADANGARIHVIDPAPRFDVSELAAQHPGSLRFHRARSLRVLPRIARPDLALIDGDHNWHTVIGELRQLERRARRDRRSPPVILLHDVEWPYARRDLYYDPEAVPARHRHPHAQAGLVPGSEDLVSPGLNAMLNNALREGGSENGVLTAVEDFLRESRASWFFMTLPGLHGLGVLVPQRRVRRGKRLSQLLEWAAGPGFLDLQCHEIDQARIQALIRVAALESELAKARADED